ncbi:MAG: cytochrome c peroxidase, partial [Gammaproteobacteria bacterium]
MAPTAILLLTLSACGGGGGAAPAATPSAVTLPQLTAKLGAVDFYGPLFTAAFGDRTVTSDRIARALAQFVRAMVSYRAKFDTAFVAGTPNFAAVFTPAELQGQQIFNGRGRCAQCHTTIAHAGD